jgi:hypothetical protein
MIVVMIIVGTLVGTMVDEIMVEIMVGIMLLLLLLLRAAITGVVIPTTGHRRSTAIRETTPAASTPLAIIRRAIIRHATIPCVIMDATTGTIGITATRTATTRTTRRLLEGAARRVETTAAKITVALGAPDRPAIGTGIVPTILGALMAVVVVVAAALPTAARTYLTETGTETATTVHIGAMIVVVMVAEAPLARSLLSTSPSPSDEPAAESGRSHYRIDVCSLGAAGRWSCGARFWMADGCIAESNWWW